MYGYEPDSTISPEQVLQKVTQQQIFEFALNLPFSFEERYCSPFRNDTKPACRFQEREDGTILFIDFGERLLTGRTHRSCFQMVIEAYTTNLAGAIKIICQEFRLSENSNDYTEIVVSNFNYTQKKVTVDITYDAKFAPTRLDIGYWSQFLIRPEHLTEDSTFCVKSFRLKRESGRFTVATPYKYCYVFDFIHQKKIYQPFNEKYKWISNCDENCIGNIDNLPATGKELVIEKAYKDHRVIRNVIEGSNVIWFQNEGCTPDLFLLKNLEERFEIITIFFDNDETGILAATKLVAIFNSFRANCARMVYLPTRLPYKDIGAFVQGEGRQDTITILKQLELCH